MASIQEETIVITVSKLHKTGSESADPIISNDVVATLEGVVEELLGNGVVVEVNKA
jgi:hypothetical protein